MAAFKAQGTKRQREQAKREKKKRKAERRIRAKETRETEPEQILSTDTGLITGGGNVA